MQWIAIAGLIGAIVCGVLAYMSREQVRAMATTETVPVEELEQLRTAAVDAGGPGSFRYTCEVVGTVRPGPDGPMKSELAKVKAVWQKQRISRKYTEVTRSGGRRRTRTRTEVVNESTSAAPFRVHDGTGAILVEPGKEEPDGAEKSRDRFKRGGKNSTELKVGSFSLSLPRRARTIGFRHEEWVLRPGRRVYVLGEATDLDGRLTLGEPVEGGVFLISTRSEQELRSRARMKVMGFGGGAALALIVAVVCAVLWLIG